MSKFQELVLPPFEPLKESELLSSPYQVLENPCTFIPDRLLWRLAKVWTPPCCRESIKRRVEELTIVKQFKNFSRAFQRGGIAVYRKFNITYDCVRLHIRNWLAPSSSWSRPLHNYKSPLRPSTVCPHRHQTLVSLQSTKIKPNTSQTKSSWHPRMFSLSGVAKDGLLAT